MLRGRAALVIRILAICLLVAFTMLLVGAADAGWEAGFDGGAAGGKALHRGSAFLSTEDLRDEGPFEECLECTAESFLPFLQRIYPKPKMAIGAWIPPEFGQYDGDIDDFENMTQEHHGMYKLYMPWKDPFTGNWIPFSTPMCQYCATMQWQADAIVNNGSVPMVNWMSLHCGVGPVKNGTYDWFIRQFAIDVRNWDHRILINWGHEMNIPAYPWSTSDTASYRAAYRHIVNIFREEGADNVEFVWSPNYMSHQLPGYNEYYPGDAYVDWVGADGYNWGSSDPRNPFRTWATFDMIFGPILADFSARYPDKPQMVSETACAPDDGGSKAQWITDAYALMKVNNTQEGNYRWLRLKAIFWFQENKEKNWLIESGPGDTRQAYRDAVDGEFFDGP